MVLHETVLSLNLIWKTKDGAGDSVAFEGTDIKFKKKKKKNTQHLWNNNNQ